MNSLLRLPPLLPFLQSGGRVWGQWVTGQLTICQAWLKVRPSTGGFLGASGDPLGNLRFIVNCPCRTRPLSVLFGIESSLSGTFTRWLDRLLFLTTFRSDLTAGSKTVFAFTLPWLELGDLTGADRGVAAAAPAAGFLGAAFGVEDLKTF